MTAHFSWSLREKRIFFFPKHSFSDPQISLRDREKHLVRENCTRTLYSVLLSFFSNLPPFLLLFHSQMPCPWSHFLCLILQSWFSFDKKRRYGHPHIHPMFHNAVLLYLICFFLIVFGSSTTLAVFLWYGSLSFFLLYLWLMYFLLTHEIKTLVYSSMLGF